MSKEEEVVVLLLFLWVHLRECSQDVLSKQTITAQRDVPVQEQDILIKQGFIGGPKWQTILCLISVL